jgi:hypothetical protein
MTDLATLYDVGRQKRGVDLACQSLTGFSAVSALAQTHSLVLFDRQYCVKSDTNDSEHELVLRCDHETPLGSWAGGRAKSAQCVERTS